MHDRIYLAGPIMHVSKKEGTTWRETVKDLYDNSLTTHVVNPLDIKMEDGTIKKDINGNLEALKKYADEIVESDFEVIDQCSGMLVNWNNDVPTAGTPIEMRYAYDRNIPIALVFKGPNKELSPFLTYHSDEIFESISEGMNYLTKDNER